jgi:hypothetical protein
MARRAALPDLTTADPFAGTWRFSATRSVLSTPGPRSWVQHIAIEGDQISLREEIDFGAGRQATVVAEARFNGKAYPVEGSPAADAIAYTRDSPHVIHGVATRNGKVTIRESMTADADAESFHMSYSVFVKGRKVARGVACFERIGRQPGG